MFGEGVAKNAVMETMYKVVKSPISAIHATALMNDYYDTMYGICDHALVADQDPLSSIGYHPAEDVEADSADVSFILRYRNSRILEKFGLSIKDFFKCTRAEAEELLRIANAELSAAAKKPPPPDVSSLEKELNRK